MTDFGRPPFDFAPAANELRVPHFGQVTREINPRFVIEATMWPRSSSQATQSFSTRSPTAYVGFSISAFVGCKSSSPIIKEATFFSQKEPYETLRMKVASEKRWQRRLAFVRSPERLLLV